MGIINTDFTMPGQDMPPQNFRDLKTQQGQINWLAQFLMSVNNVFDNVSGSVTTLAEDQSAYVEITFDDENNTATFDFYLPRGYRGYPGSMENVTATATTLAPGSSATVSVTLDQPTQSLAFSFGLPEGTPATDAQTASAVAAWIEAHPEAVTTVQDGAVSTVKLADGAVTFAKLASDVKAILDAKANLDGYAPLLTAGVAESVLSSDEQQATFTQRVSDHDGSVGVRSILGNTITWNQLVDTNTTAVGIPVGNIYIAYINGVETRGTGTSTALTVTGGSDCVFDLTRMFGAGNEPATIAEFKALYPDSYYPYNAGELVSVNIDGVKAVGFNLFDGVIEAGGINTGTGADTSTSGYYRSKNYNHVIGGKDYYFKIPVDMNVMWYDSNKAFITWEGVQAATYNIKTAPANACYFRFRNANANTWTPKESDQICINISDESLNGQYKPYTNSIREIDTSEYFEDGIKSAGSVYDEIASDAAVQRIGIVDLGTLTWEKQPLNDNIRFRSNAISNAKFFGNVTQVNPIVCALYKTVTGNAAYTANKSIAIGGTADTRIYIKDDSYDYNSPSTFKAAMSGVYAYYELATPTTTPIDPPINMDYPTQQGGIESIIIPESEQSSPIKLVYTQGYDANGVANIALEVIAPIEGAKASNNYAIGSFFVYAGKLYKATSAITSGETITPGTNCTQTTVMAEILALG